MFKILGDRPLPLRTAPLVLKCEGSTPLATVCVIFCAAIQGESRGGEVGTVRLFRKRLGEMLLEDGVISGEDLEAALEHSKQRLVPVGRALLELGRVDEALLSVYLEKQLGESLVERGLLNHEQLDRIVTRSQALTEPLGSMAVRFGYLTDEDLAQLMALDYGLPCLRLRQLKVDPDTARLLPPELALQALFLPIDITGDVLSVATARPYDEIMVRDLEESTGMSVSLVVVPEQELRAAIRHYNPEVKETPDES
ncbi:hypothetical protein JXA88_15975 [Candidatus Fermentibacteria bacterium]|nr:hypothetical protein [Candidatus Fermentibacteria bacterium]